MVDEVQSAADLIDKWAAKLVTVAEQHGPQAAELALAVGQIGAIQALATGAASLTMCVIFSFTAYKLTKAHLGKKSIHDGYFERDRGKETSTSDQAVAAHGPMYLYGLGAALCGTGALFTFIGAVVRLSNIYAWAGLWRPEIYLAAKALGL